MDNLKKALNVLRKFEGTIHESNFEQFTIDFVQNKEMELNDVISVGEQEGFGEYAERTENDLIGALQYDVSCILDIVKDGKDKFLFENLQREIENL